ncbi:MAG: CocE/NonD family hydrolase [Planctomycetota bacterium]
MNRSPLFLYRFVSIPALILLCLSTCLQCSDRPSDPDHLAPLRKADFVEEEVMVPMRDGTLLATYIALPEEAAPPYPVILQRTPYGKSFSVAPDYIQAGYAFVVQDTRGRYKSQGEFFPFVNEGVDGFDTIEWIARQPWCNGNVGMTGYSYQASAQLLAAMENPPHLRCISVAVPASDLDGGAYFCGGALRLELVMAWLLGQSATGKRVLENKAPRHEVRKWAESGQFDMWRFHLPLKDRGPMDLGGDSYGRCWEEIVTHWEDPAHWRACSPLYHADKILVPVLIQEGFYDIFSRENIALWSALRQKGGSPAAREQTCLLLGPWSHTLGAPVGAKSFPEANSALKGLDKQWFDQWLKQEEGSPATALWPTLRFFVMNSNDWMECDGWPPHEATQERWYLSTDSLKPIPPPADEPPQTYTYDPNHPVSTFGGNNLAITRGIQNQARLGNRSDVLAFRSAPMENAMTLAGPVEVKLHVSSSAWDTDFTAMLVDESPDHYQSNVLDGIIRLRYRNGRDSSQVLEPGEETAVDIDLWSTAWTFLKGHRIVLYISSSNFPRFDRNTNTLAHPAEAVQLLKARNTVFHDAAHPSALSFWRLPPSDMHDVSHKHRKK